LLWLLLTLLVVGVGVTVFLGQQTVPHAPTEPPAVATDSHRVPLLVIATNEVLDAVLERVSDTVRRLELPLDTPLVPARVLRFETKPVLAGRPSSLRSEVKYDGGYEFRHQDGIVYELRTPHSRREQVSQETGSNQGRVKGESFKEGMELAGPILRRALRRLDYRDVSVIGDNPMVMRWFDWIDPSPSIGSWHGEPVCAAELSSWRGGCRQRIPQTVRLLARSVRCAGPGPPHEWDDLGQPIR
jgi:hypothetical protein